MTQGNSAQSLSLSNMNNAGGHFQMPLSEQDIMLLQDMFLTPGLHTIAVKTPEKGRQIMREILHSLSYYNAIAAFSLMCQDFAKLSPHEVHAHTYKYVVGKKNEHEFFDDHYDFIWIEATPALLATRWYTTLEQKLTEIHKNHAIPIVIVSS